MVNAGHGTGGLGAAVHDRGVELAEAVGVEDGAFAGVEERRVLHHVDGGRDRIQRRAAFFQDNVTGVQRLGQPGAIVSLARRTQGGSLNHSGTAVNDKAVGAIGSLDKRNEETAENN